MILEEGATVFQGAILSRIQALPSHNTLNLPLYTMKDMNQNIGKDYLGSKERIQEIHVPKSKLKSLPIATKGMVLVNLTAHKAAAINLEHVGKLIPSNFAIIKPNVTLDVNYLEWFINDHPICKKQLQIATQGSSTTALSIQMLRSLNIEVLEIGKQRKIGEIYRGLYQKKCLLNERFRLEEKLTKHLLMSFTKEEM